MKLPYAPLNQISKLDKVTVNPAQYSDTQVELYSLPAFDRGAEPEIVYGREIRSNKLLISEPSVLVSKLNPETSRVWLVYPGLKPSLASTEFMVLRPKNVNLSYLFSVCKSPYFRNQLVKLVTGTSNSHQRVQAKDFFDVLVPLISEHTSEDLGDLITSLQRRIQKSKSRVKLIDEVIAMTFDQFFPKVFEEIRQLGDFIDVATGVSYSSRDFGGENQALLTLKSFGRDGGYNPAGLRSWKGAFRQEQQVHKGEIIVANTDISQAGEVLGRAIVVRESLKFPTLVASMDMSVIRPKNTLTNEFLLGLTRHPVFKAYCRSRANGTTVLHLPRRSVGEFLFNPPTVKAITEYSQIVTHLVMLQSKEEELVGNLLSLQQTKLEIFG